MFHSQYLSSPVSNPREKYLAALAEARAAEAEYLAAERLQQEEDNLRQRLEQIQRLKHNNNHTQSLTDSFAPSFGYQYQHYPQNPTHTPTHSMDLLRQQIAAEERARLLREQEQTKQLKALRKRQEEERAIARQAEIEALRRAQVAREQERSRALAAQNTTLAALVQRISEQPVPRRSHHPSHCDRRPPRPEFAFEFTPRHHQQSNRHQVAAEEFLKTLSGLQKEPKPKAEPQVIDIQDFLNHLARATAPQPPAPAPKPKVQPAEAPVTLDQLISSFYKAAGVEVAQQPTSAAASNPQPEPSKTPAPAPAPASQSAAAVPSQPAPTPAAAQPTPAPKTTTTPQPVGFEHILNHILGAAAAQPSNSNQVDMQQLLNMFFGGHQQPAQAPEASSSKPKLTEATLKEELQARLRTEQGSEDQDLAEAIRMSLADLDAANTAPPDTKGKAPAPAPVNNLATSAAEVKSIDASFTSLSNEFVFPDQLDFSTSRSSSPARSIASDASSESILSKLSYNARNQPVRFYHQALSGLLGRLDAVESFGDEEVRHARKEVVGRVEGALDEVEKVIEARWRKFVGKEERPVEVEGAAEPEEAPVVVSTEDVPAPEAPIVPAEDVTAPHAPEASSNVTPESESEPAVVEPSDSTAAEVAPSPAAEPSASEVSSYPPSAPSSYPPSLANLVSESVETIRPYDAAPSSPVAASDNDTDVDTFLLPAASEEQPAKKPRATDEDVGSDWSEVDA